MMDWILDMGIPLDSFSHRDNYRTDHYNHSDSLLDISYNQVEKYIPAGSSKRKTYYLKVDKILMIYNLGVNDISLLVFIDLQVRSWYLSIFGILPNDIALTGSVHLSQ